MALDSDMVASCGRDLNALGLDKGPTYSGARLDYKSFWYDMEPFCMLKGLGPTMRGDNRADKDSADAKKAAEYERLSLLLWRLLTRAISTTTESGKMLKMQVEQEFGNDRDGYELSEYLRAYGNKISREDLSRR